MLLGAHSTRPAVCWHLSVCWAPSGGRAAPSFGLASCHLDAQEISCAGRPALRRPGGPSRPPGPPARSPARAPLILPAHMIRLHSDFVGCLPRRPFFGGPRPLPPPPRGARAPQPARASARPRREVVCTVCPPRSIYQRTLPPWLRCLFRRRGGHTAYMPASSAVLHVLSGQQRIAPRSAERPFRQQWPRPSQRWR